MGAGGIAASNLMPTSYGGASAAATLALLSQGVNAVLNSGKALAFVAGALEGALALAAGGGAFLAFMPSAGGHGAPEALKLRGFDAFFDKATRLIADRGSDTKPLEQARLLFNGLRRQGRFGEAAQVFDLVLKGLGPQLLGRDGGNVSRYTAKTLLGREEVAWAQSHGRPRIAAPADPVTKTRPSSRVGNAASRGASSAPTQQQIGSVAQEAQARFVAANRTGLQALGTRRDALFASVQQLLNKTGDQPELRGRTAALQATFSSLQKQLDQAAVLSGAVSALKAYPAVPGLVDADGKALTLPQLQQRLATVTSQVRSLGEQLGRQLGAVETSLRSHQERLAEGLASKAGATLQATLGAMDARLQTLSRAPGVDPSAVSGLVQARNDYAAAADTVRRLQPAADLISLGFTGTVSLKGEPLSRMQVNEQLGAAQSQLASASKAFEEADATLAPDTQGRAAGTTTNLQFPDIQTSTNRVELATPPKEAGRLAAEQIGAATRRLAGQMTAPATLHAKEQFLERVVHEAAAAYPGATPEEQVTRLLSDLGIPRDLIWRDRPNDNIPVDRFAMSDKPATAASSGGSKQQPEDPNKKPNDPKINPKLRTLVLTVVAGIVIDHLPIAAGWKLVGNLIPWGGHGAGEAKEALQASKAMRLLLREGEHFVDDGAYIALKNGRLLKTEVRLAQEVMKKDGRLLARREAGQEVGTLEEFSADLERWLRPDEQLVKVGGLNVSGPELKKRLIEGFEAKLAQKTRSFKGTAAEFQGPTGRGPLCEQRVGRLRYRRCDAGSPSQGGSERAQGQGQFGSVRPSCELQSGRRRVGRRTGTRGRPGTFSARLAGGGTEVRRFTGRQALLGNQPRPPVDPGGRRERRTRPDASNDLVATAVDAAAA